MPRQRTHRDLATFEPIVLVSVDDVLYAASELDGSAAGYDHHINVAGLSGRPRPLLAPRG
jgi:hypothetical protein